MQALLRDVRYGLRALLKSPGLAIVATLALTLGIGLTTTMFSIVYGALMKGLPYPDGDRIVVVQRANPVRGIQRQSLPIQDFVDYKAQQHVLTDLGAFTSGTIYVSGEEKAERFDGSWITANMFDILGVRPMLGRNVPRGRRHAERRQGRDPLVLDVARAIQREREHHRQADSRERRAVLGRRRDAGRFRVSEQRQDLGAAADRSARGQARRRPVRAGVRQAQAGRLARSRDRRADDDRQATRRRVQGEQRGLHRRRAVVHRQLHRQGAAAAALHDAGRRVLRAAHRVRQRREPAARPRRAPHQGSRHPHRARRVALGGRPSVPRRGASCCRLAATVFGIALAYFGISLFNQAITVTQVPFFIDIRLHPPVLLFSIGVAALTTLIAGAIPAYQSSRADINEILKDESRGASSFRIGRISKALVMFEIALSCGLLVAAGLMIKSVTKMRTMDPGFTTKDVFTARIGFPAAYTDTAAEWRFFDQVVERVAALPGVQARGAQHRASRGAPGHERHAVRHGRPDVSQGQGLSVRAHARRHAEVLLDAQDSARRGTRLHRRRSRRRASGGRS